MKKPIEHIPINSVAELHRLMGLHKPLHPLITVIQFQDVPRVVQANSVSLVINLYGISLKKNLSGKLKYGQGYYDFDEGVLGMTAPGQVLASDSPGEFHAEGWWLLFHPDFIQGYPLANHIRKFGFFFYSVREALHLTEREELQMETILKNIVTEYETAIDLHSQDLMVSHLELLLNYANRYYARQFATRKIVNQPIVEKFEALLDAYFQSEKSEQGLPAVTFFSEQIHTSPHYLSDLLRKYTGQSAQQHIHGKLIEMAKLKLSTTDLTVSEIAYQLGFGHPQSFIKLFKAKEKKTPLEFRQMFYS